jgi:hypothetical protein
MSRTYNLCVQDSIPVRPQRHYWLPLGKPFLPFQRIRIYLARDYVHSSVCDIQAVVCELHTNARDGVDEPMMRNRHDGTI